MNASAGAPRVRRGAVVVARLRAVLAANVFTWFVAATVAVIAHLIGQPTVVRSTGVGLLVAGGLIMFGGGNVLERGANLNSSSWGVSVNRHRDEETKDTKGFGDLTSLGAALFAGLPNAIVGMYLMG